MKEWTSRLESSTEFYLKLPDKTCPECGERVDEQCESYENTCSSCITKAQSIE